MVSILLCMSINITWDGTYIYGDIIDHVPIWPAKNRFLFPKLALTSKFFTLYFFTFVSVKDIDKYLQKHSSCLTLTKCWQRTLYFIQLFFSELKWICLHWSLLNFKSLLVPLFYSLAWYFEYSIQQMNYLSASVIHVNFISLHDMPLVELCLRL